MARSAPCCAPSPTGTPRSTRAWPGARSAGCGRSSSRSPTRSPSTRATSWRASPSRRPRPSAPCRRWPRRSRRSPGPTPTGCARTPRGCSAMRPTEGASSSSLCSDARNAQDEDAFGRQEALQADRQRQGQGASRLHEPHLGEEEPEGEARPRQARDPVQQGRAARQKAAARGFITMARVKRSLHAKKKRRAVLALTKGYRGEAHSNYKRAKEALIKADSYAYRDRRNRKRDFRRLWITRINAAARQNGMSYGTFMHGLKPAGIELDRKVLADIAVRDAETFRRFAEAAREASAA